MPQRNYIATSTCLPIKGAFRSVIMDLGRNTYEYVPNSVVDFLNMVSLKSVNEIYNDTPSESKEIISEYIEYCIDKEYILEIPQEIDKKHFPKLDLTFFTPNIITNFCVEINNYSNFDFKQMALLLETTKCYNIQLLFKEKYNLNLIDGHLDEISKIGLRSIEIILEYNAHFDYNNLISKHKNISFIFIYSAPKTELIKQHYYGVQQIFSSTKNYSAALNRSIEEFNVNITLYTEAQKHNTYFNRKLYIGVNGEIKNAPESIEVFGNIDTLNNQNELLNIINTKEFQKYWYVHKDLIDVCKHCEYRYMCIDNRLPIKRNEKEWYMETECNFNPYIAKWKTEQGYKTLAACGVENNASDFKVNRKKLNAINKELWGDD
jgi:SPASM domain peptide maturase of grasp-with-spasm system